MANYSAGLEELRVQSEKLYISHLLTGNRDDIQEAVRCAQKVFDLMPPADASMPIIQYNLARSLFRKFLEMRQVEDIKMAIEMFRRASQATSEPLPDDMCQKCSHYLTISCFVRDGNLDEFLQLNAPDVYSQSGPLLQIKAFTHKLDEDERFEALSRQEDLDNAFVYATQAMKIFNAAEHAEPGMNMNSRGVAFLQCLDNLARVMSNRYRATGEVNDLNTAIDASSRAIDIAETNDPQKDLHRLLSNFAANLKLRVLRTGHAEDMRLAIKALQRALDIWPPKDPRWVQCLVNLISLENMQGWRLMDGEYDKRAFQHLEEALSSTVEENFGLNPGLDSPLISRPILDGSVTFALRNFSDMVWSEQTEAIARKYISSEFTHHPLAGASFRIVSSCVFDRWKRTHAIKYIDEAISIARCMVERAGSAPDQLIMAWLTLGCRLYDRYKSIGDDKNCDEAVAVLLKGLRMSAGAPAHRIMVGQEAIRILSELANWDRARELSREIVDLLVILNGRSLEWQDKQFWLRQFSDQGATYASIALQAGSDVLDVIDVLETCRGSILGHVIDYRTDLVDLTKAAPKKAERFRTLQDEMNAVIDPSGNTNTRVEQITRKGKAEGEFRTCLEEIRKLEGFHRFLRGPSETELKAAAARGPIVIVNITSIRSDAIIITRDASVLLPLPELKYQEVAEYCEADLTNFFSIEELREKNKKYIRVQKWLWNNCVKLIFEKLHDLVSAPTKLHIWWIGVGIASTLPFHAAANYTAPDISESTLSRAISSYTPTLKILIHGRRKLKNDRPKPNVQGSTSKPKMAIIIMPSTPGKSELEGVEEEAEAVEHIVSDTYSLDIISQPSAKDVMARMRECEVMHFACHGESILSDPSSSHLLLQATIPDSEPAIDELKVRDVAAAALSGKLAFLSACSTAQNKLTTLRDEVIHLASGFQVADYLHAIGNLWPADDSISVKLLEEFYKHLVAAGELGDGHNVAKALNEALIVVAKKRAKQPLSWAQYVHFGV